MTRRAIASLVAALATLILVGITAAPADAACRRRHCAPAPPVATPPTTPPAAVVYRDDFDNLSAWRLYDSAGHDGQGVRSPSAISASGGLLTITGTAAGTTGGMSLVGHDIRYGTVNVRMRAPVGAGRYHPVILLWGLGSGSDVNAVTGEIDFAEMWNRPARDRTTFTLHYGDGSQMVGADAPPFDGTQWHVYSVTWAPSYIRASIDGIQYYYTTDIAKFPKVAMELCVQLDWFPGEPTTAGSASMQVDYAEITT